jgi:3-oxoacyl-ACP reductase-like protein
MKDLVGGKSTLQNEILGDLHSEFALAPEKVKNFLLKSSVVSVYDQRSGISLASPDAGRPSGVGGAVAVVNCEGFLKFQSDQQNFAAQHVELYMRCKPSTINREHDNPYMEGIQPRYDILMARHFDSSWNWVHQDAFSMSFFGCGPIQIKPVSQRQHSSVQMKNCTLSLRNHFQLSEIALQPIFLLQA